MLPSFLPQFSPQGLFSGVPGAGLPYISPALFGQPGAYGFNGSLGYPSSPGVVAQTPYPPLGATNPFFYQTPFVSNPGLNSYISTAGTQHPAQQIVLLLGQLAQQFSVQGAVNEHIAYALQHLAHQLISYQLLVQQGQPFIGAGQAFGLGAPFLPGMFAGVPQGGYGFSPQFSPQQAQAWGASRPQTTIQ